MSGFRLQPAVVAQLDEIHDYTQSRWGEEQAEHYAAGAFALFGAISRGEVYWHRLLEPRGVDGFFQRYEQHMVYWRGTTGNVEIVAILHQRMIRDQRLQTLFDA